MRNTAQRPTSLQNLIMCGFLGVFGAVHDVSDERLIRLGEIGKHRGPDDSCLWGDQTCRMYFNRLAIVDLSVAGRQPMSSPSGRWTIVFNGEIYNHTDLRKRLPAKNYVGHSDTETLLWAIENLGFDAAVESLNGIFGIAAYDGMTRQIWFARDFAGVKPLYYSKCKGKVWFSSQFDQVVLGVGLDRLQISQSGMRDFLQLGYMPAPNTIYKDVFQVNAGEIVRFDENTRQTQRRYYELPKFEIEEQIGAGSKSVAFLDLMGEVVGEQMLADVPLGSFISGGIDSPLIAAFASKVNRSIVTFTVGSDDKDFNEIPTGKRYAEYLGVQHRSRVVSENEIDLAVSASVSANSEPFGEPSSIPTYVVTKHAREHTTVMLSGDGADELFWGYPRWNRLLQSYNLFSRRKFLRRFEISARRRFGDSVSCGPTLFETPGEWVLNGQSYNDIPLMNAMMPQSRNSDAVASLYEFNYTPNRRQFRDWLRWNEFYGHLQRVLVKVDRMSMANSLEVRVPFLDRRVVEFAWRLKSEFGFDNYDNKTILKETLARFIPDEDINKEKLGFSVPLGNWLRGRLRRKVKETLLDSDWYGVDHIDRTILTKYVEDFFSGVHYCDWGIWILYNWQCWGSSIRSRVP